MSNHSQGSNGLPARVSWLTALWRRWKFRRCWQGHHIEDFDMPDISTVRLLCGRCGMVRDLGPHGPLTFQATSEWRTP